tara:strand:- start:573 stop:725 length:153 start_codon:yes stop_codon:yes gene_type:complete
MELTVQQARRVFKANKEYRVLQVRRDRQEPMALMEHKVRKEIPEIKGRRV